MKTEFLNLIKNIAGLDISSSPNYKTILALAKHPKAFYPNPALVASKLKIDVNQEFVNDKDLFEPTVDVYVNCLSKLYSQMQNDFGADAPKMFDLFLDSRDFNLQYNNN